MNKPNLKRLSEILCSALKRNKITGKKLAFLVGIDEGYVSKLSTGSALYAPSVEVLEKIHETLDLESEGYSLEVFCYIAGRHTEKSESVMKYLMQEFPEEFSKLIHFLEEDPEKIKNLLENAIE